MSRDWGIAGRTPSRRPRVGMRLSREKRIESKAGPSASASLTRHGSCSSTDVEEQQSHAPSIRQSPTEFVAGRQVPHHDGTAIAAGGRLLSGLPLRSTRTNTSLRRAHVIGRPARLSAHPPSPALVCRCAQLGARCCLHTAGESRVGDDLLRVPERRRRLV